MFAIIKIGGKQYKVAKGDKLEVEKVDAKEGGSFKIDKVLLINDSGVKIGTPLIEGAYVEAKVASHQKGDKVIIYKMKSKKRYRRKTGHRQSLTTIEILDIKATGGAAHKAKEATVEAKPETKSEAKPEAKALPPSGTKKPAAKKAPVKKLAKAKKE